MRNNLQVFKDFVNGLDDSETVTVSVGNLNWLIGYCDESLRFEKDSGKTIEQLHELISNFEGVLSKEIEGNKAISGNGVRGNTFQDGVTLGLETAKSMYLVRVIQKAIRMNE